LRLGSTPRRAALRNATTNFSRLEFNLFSRDFLVRLEAFLLPVAAAAAASFGA